MSSLSLSWMLKMQYK